MARVNLWPPTEDLERAKALYLAQFAHVDCGGAPVAYVNGSELGCTGCKQRWPGAGSLAAAVEATGEFRSLFDERF